MGAPKKIPNVPELRRIIDEARVVAVRFGPPVLLKPLLTQFGQYWENGEAGNFFDWWGSAATQVSEEVMSREDRQAYIGACGRVVANGNQLALAAFNITAYDSVGLAMGIYSFYHGLEEVIKDANKVDPHFKLI